MAPIKSSLARSVGKLLGVSKNVDLGLRGHVPISRWKVGTLDNPYTDFNDISVSGVWYVKPSGYTGTAFQTYVDVDTAGGPWALTWIVTNANGDDVDWFDGDSSMSGSTGTNHFTTISTLGSTTSPTSKNNAKNPIFDYYSFTNMRIDENHSGTTGTKTYQLNTTNTFRHHFNNATGSDLVSSVLTTTGSFTTFTSSNLYFNLDLGNDGARIAATTASNEAVGGISARVDGGRSYAWAGNITSSSGSRTFSADGTTTDHTVWIWVK
jgi:hypothetical protein